MESLLVENKSLVVSLRDNGSGLKCADFERMVSTEYEPDQGKNGGRKGLGVRLVNMMLQKNGCWIRCVNTNRGTHLQLSLPVQMNDSVLALDQNLIKGLDYDKINKQNGGLV